MTEERIIDIFDMEDKLDRTITSLDDCTQAEILWCLSSTYSRYLENPEQLEYLLNAELVTQYPKIDSLPSDKLNGIIEFERYTTEEGTNTETNKKLTYISMTEFNRKFNEYSNSGNEDVFNYFTIDDEENVIVAVWTREEGAFKSNNTTLQEQKKIESGYDETKIKERYDQRYSVDSETTDLVTANYVTYSIAKTKINYKSLIGQYTLPFEYLWVLMVMGREYDFVKELADLAYNSEIVIGIYDDITTTININKKEYTENFREKYEKYEKEEGGSETLVENTDWEEESYSYYEENKITTTYNTVQVDIRRVDTWIVRESREYTNTQYSTTTLNQTTNQPDEDWSDNGSETVNSQTTRFRLVEQKDAYGNTIVDTLTGAPLYTTEPYTVYIREEYYREKKLTDQSNLTKLDINYNKYQKGTSIVEEKVSLDDSQGPNFVNLIRKEENINAYRLITDKKVTSWLVESLKKNEDTVNMVDITLYLLNKSTESSSYIDESNTSFDDIWTDIVIANTPVTAVGEDYIVDITKSSSNLVITDANVLREAINSIYTGQAKSNLLSQLNTFLEMQSTYNVNAVFAIAVTQIESSCGTNWAAIDSSTYNWMSMTGSYNGNSYRNPNSSNPRTWRVYPSFREATLDFGNVIANGSYYFQALLLYEERDGHRKR